MRWWWSVGVRRSGRGLRFGAAADVHDHVHRPSDSHRLVREGFSRRGAGPDQRRCRSTRASSRARCRSRRPRSSRTAGARVWRGQLGLATVCRSVHVHRSRSGAHATASELRRGRRRTPRFKRSGRARACRVTCGRASRSLAPLRIEQMSLRRLLDAEDARLERERTLPKGAADLLCARFRSRGPCRHDPARCTISSRSLTFRFATSKKLSLRTRSARPSARICATCSASSRRVSLRWRAPPPRW